MPTAGVRLCPEHTFASYDLAIAQKADFVEPDLCRVEDGVLICLHDDTLERTTNVAKVYPDRFSPDVKGRNGERRWVANDFTVAELKKLDAGSWRDAKFAVRRCRPGTRCWRACRRIPEWASAELKSPPLYTARGGHGEDLFVTSVKQHGLDKGGVAEEDAGHHPVVRSADHRTHVGGAADHSARVPDV